MKLKLFLFANGGKSHDFPIKQSILNWQAVSLFLYVFFFNFWGSFHRIAIFTILSWIFEVKTWKKWIFLVIENALPSLALVRLQKSKILMKSQVEWDRKSSQKQEKVVRLFKERWMEILEFSRKLTYLRTKKDVLYIENKDEKYFLDFFSKENVI